MKSIVVKHSFIKILNYLILYLIIVYLSKNTSQSILSNYFYLINLFNFTIIIINYGISNSSQNLIPKLLNLKKIDKINNFIFQHFFIVFFNNVIFILILVFFFNKNEYYLYFIYALLASYLFSISEILRAMGRPYIGQILIYFLLVLLNLLLIIFFDKYFYLTNNIFLLIFIISASICFILFCIFLKKNKLLQQFKFNFKDFILIYKYYINNFFEAFNSYFYGFLTYIITIILFHYSNDIDVIYFNLAFMFSSIVGLPLTFLNLNNASRLSLSYLKDWNDIIYTYKKIAYTSFIFSLILFPIITISLFFFSHYFFTVNFTEYYLIFFILSFAIIINSFFGPNQILMIVSGNSKLLLITNTILIFIISIFYYFYLELNAQNFSFAVLIYYFFINLILHFYLLKKFNLKLF